MIILSRISNRHTSGLGTAPYAGFNDSHWIQINYFLAEFSKFNCVIDVWDFYCNLSLFNFVSAFAADWTIPMDVMLLTVEITSLITSHVLHFFFQNALIILGCFYTLVSVLKVCRVCTCGTKKKSPISIEEPPPSLPGGGGGGLKFNWHPMYK